MPYYVDKATRHLSIAYYNSPFSKLLPLISHFTETAQKCKAAPCASPLSFRASDRITGAGIRPPKSGSPRRAALSGRRGRRPLRVVHPTKTCGVPDGCRAESSGRGTAPPAPCFRSCAYPRRRLISRNTVDTSRMPTASEPAMPTVSSPLPTAVIISPSSPRLMV